VEFLRAVPVLLMMIFLWLALGRSNLVDDAPFVAVVIALTLYNGSVIAELIRSGVQGLPKGQREAGLAIGMTQMQSLRAIEVPQALIAMLPALVSQFVVILKDSALGYIIGFPELLQNARRLGVGEGQPAAVAPDRRGDLHRHQLRALLPGHEALHPAELPDQGQAARTSMDGSCRRARGNPLALSGTARTAPPSTPKEPRSARLTGALFRPDGGGLACQPAGQGAQAPAHLVRVNMLIVAVCQGARPRARS
jgi:hypothetical protein